MEKDKKDLQKFARIISTIIILAMFITVLLAVIEPYRQASNDLDKKFVVVRSMGLFGFTALALAIFAKLFEKFFTQFENLRNLHRFSIVMKGLTTVFVFIHIYVILQLLSQGYFLYSNLEIFMPFNKGALSDSYWLGLNLGVIAFYLLIIPTNRFLFSKKSIWLDILLFVVFGISFWHSWLIGSELQRGFIKLLWLFYGLIFVTGLISFFNNRKAKS